MNLHKSSTTVLVSESGEISLIVYSGELTQENVAKNSAKIKAAFPALPPEFFKLLVDRIKERGFSDERLSDAVNNVIDNCPYPTPTLANFLSFDKRVKVLGYDELCNLVTAGETEFKYFSHLRIKGKLFYVRTSDKEIYNIPDEL